MTIGTRLRRLRLAKGMTQRQLAGDRYTHAYVSSLESDRRRPSREALAHLAQQLDVDVDELATGRPAGLAVTLRLRLEEARAAVSNGAAPEVEQEVEAIAKQARRHALVRHEARAEVILGALLERRGRPADALRRYERAEALLAGEPPTVRVDAVDGKASCHAALGDARYAIHLLESLLAEIRREGLSDPDALAHVHASLLANYLDAGLHARAAASADELQKLAPALTDPARIGRMHMEVARLHLASRRLADAERSLDRAADAFHGERLEAERGRANLARGHALSRAGRLDDARAALSAALEAFERTGGAKDLPRALNELARVERLRGERARARELLERSLETIPSNAGPLLATAHRELGLVLLDEDPPVAERHLRSAIALFERAEQPLDVAVTYRALGDLLRERGDDGAGEAYRTGILALEPAP